MRQSKVRILLWDSYCKCAPRVSCLAIHCKCPLSVILRQWWKGALDWEWVHHLVGRLLSNAQGGVTWVAPIRCEAGTGSGGRQAGDASFPHSASTQAHCHPNTQATLAIAIPLHQQDESLKKSSVHQVVLVPRAHCIRISSALAVIVTAPQNCSLLRLIEEQWCQVDRLHIRRYRWATRLPLWLSCERTHLSM